MVISYGSVNGVDESFVRVEVEYIEFENSETKDYFSKKTFMADILATMFEAVYGEREVKEGDIVLVEHEVEDVYGIVGICDDERERRVQMIAMLISGGMC